MRHRKAFSGQFLDGLLELLVTGASIGRFHSNPEVFENSSKDVEKRMHSESEELKKRCRDPSVRRKELSQSSHHDVLVRVRPDEELSRLVDLHVPALSFYYGAR